MKYRSQNERASRRQNKLRRYYKYVRSFEKRPILMFTIIKRRLAHKPSYLGRKILFSKDEFVAKVLADPAYLKIFNKWRIADFEYGLTPTVDRIKNDKDYSLDNIQILTLIENSRKGKR